QKYCDILGYDWGTLSQMTFRDVTHPDDLDTNVAQLNGLMRGDVATVTTEKRYLHRSGAIVWANLTMSLQRDEAAGATARIAIVQDITEQKHLEAELRSAKAAAESASKAKDDFLANVSHEIRTPMNAILGLTELVLDTDLGEDQSDLLKIVQSAGASLLGII